MARPVPRPRPSRGCAGAFEGGRLPPDDYIPSGNLYADSFKHHFPDLRTRWARSGHFIPEEAPERTNEVLLEFLAGRI